MLKWKMLNGNFYINVLSEHFKGSLVRLKYDGAGFTLQTQTMSGN